MDILFSLGKGFLLGGSICLLGFLVDTHFCKESLKNMQEQQLELYNKGVETVQTNIMIIGPMFYTLVDQTLLTHSYEIQFLNILSMLAIHSIGYYGVHYYMHKIPVLYSIHKFHHSFDRFLLPSIGNAVSFEEFFLAYMGPFIFGAYVLRPNEISFVIPIGIIGILNLVIHCKELEDVPWNKYFVSPKNHIEHHEKRTGHYAAPTVNLDYVFQGY